MCIYLKTFIIRLVYTRELDHVSFVGLLRETCSGVMCLQENEGRDNERFKNLPRRGTCKELDQYKLCFIIPYVVFLSYGE